MPNKFLPGDALSNESLRRTFGLFATGVTVVTARAEDGPVGVAVNAFCSVSLDPPLILVCAGAQSESWPVIKAVGPFAVNILAEGQGALCKRFSRKGLDRFAGIAERPGYTGAPLLVDASVASLECLPHSEHVAGDHTIVVGRVVALHEYEQTSPLVFFSSDFRQLRPTERPVS
jgi:3-hydroxy-9,10-secoandrosta-1,3,5(10)-triene-9,17-dione monooxygenase reductase component